MKKRADYRITNILSYPHWHLRIHLDQAYLGRSVLWRRKRGNAVSPTVLSVEERDESILIAALWEKAVTSFWQPTRFNHAWLCNMTHEHGGHGHWHLIPRYSEARRWRGKFFTDANPLGNYAPYKSSVVEREFLVLLRNDLREAMEELGA